MCRASRGCCSLPPRPRWECCGGAGQLWLCRAALTRPDTFQCLSLHVHCHDPPPYNLRRSAPPLAIAPLLQPFPAPMAARGTLTSPLPPPLSPALQCPLPSAMGPLLQPVSAPMAALGTLAEGRRSPAFNHIKALAESVHCLSWLAYTGPSCGERV